MKYSYKVSENDYLSMLTAMIRQQDRTPFRRLILFLFTIGQMGLTVWLCLTRLEKKQWAFYMAGSLLLAAVSIVWTLSVRFRAEATLKQIKSNGQLPKDFWELHRLEETKDGLVLSFGSVRQICAEGSPLSFREEDGLLWLKAGARVFDIVPESAFSSKNEKEKFKAELRAFQEKSAEKNASSEREEDDNTLYLQYPSDQEGFIRTQAEAVRTIYVRHQLFQAGSLMKIAATVTLIVVAALNFSVWTAALTAAFAVFLNDKLFIVFTPLLRTRMRKDLRGWADDGQIRLSALKNGIRMIGGSQETFVPYKSILNSEMTKVGQVMSWGKLPSVIVPETLTKTEEGKAFLNKVQARTPVRRPAPPNLPRFRRSRF